MKVQEFKVVDHLMKNLSPLVLACFRRKRGESHLFPVHSFQSSGVRDISVFLWVACFHCSEKLLEVFLGPPCRLIYGYRLIQVCGLIWVYRLGVRTGKTANNQSMKIHFTFFFTSYLFSQSCDLRRLISDTNK